MSAESVRQARARYFADNDFGNDGGYSAKWVQIKLGRLPIAFPNTPARIAAVKLHDLHHVATGYATDATGEAEISAWEIAAGCGSFVAAWILNLWAMGYGVLIAPGRIWRAFRRGRRSRTLYHRSEGADDPLLDGSVAGLQQVLELPAEPITTTPADVVAFVGWTTVAWVWVLVTLALLLSPFALLARAVF